MESIKGWDWTELADVWGITVDKTISYFKRDEDYQWVLATEPWTEELEESYPAGIVKVEKYMKEFVNGDFIIRLTDEEDILANKVKDFLYLKLADNDMSLPDDIKRVLVTFLDKLVRNSHHGDKKIIQAIADSDDYTMVMWVCRNLRSLWC